MTATPKLRRYITFWPLVVFGVGDMLGAGIYGLIGKAAGELGNAVWLAFLGSMIAALCTGLSYAALGSRFPRAAGSAYIAQRVFKWGFLSYVVGLASIASGLTSIAAATHAFSGYLQGLLPGASSVVLGIFFILLLTYINYLGIQFSSRFNLFCTLVEVAGLVVVIVLGVKYWGTVNYFEVPKIHAAEGLSLPLILQGAVLTFYSFVGFEDLLNLSEEVKEPERTFPRALILSVVIAAGLYMAVGISAVSILPYTELAQSNRPLVDVVVRALPWFPPTVFTVVSLISVMNTALMNHLMGSRLFYGMSNHQLLPKFLGRVGHTKTPVVAIFVVTAIVFVLVFSGDIRVLARATSILLLGVFTVVNLSLVVLKVRKEEGKGFHVPLAVPVIGVLSCVLVLSHASQGEFEIAGWVGMVIVALYFVVRPRNISLEDFTEV